MILLLLSEEEDKLLIQIYRGYYPLLKHMARGIVNDSFTADDMVHEAILKLIRYLPNLQKLERKALMAYCVRTVESVCISYIRKESRRKIVLNDQTIEFLPEELIEKDEIKEKVNNVLSELSQLDRHLLIYKYIMGYSHKEIGCLLGIEPKYISTYIKRARDRAKRILMEKGD